MKLSQMFPSKYLQAEDLPPNQNTIVTIEKLYPAAARDRGGDSEPEVKWMVRFHEFRKPMSLWRTTANSIAKVLGTDDTDKWVGQQIAIYPATYVSFGETKPCVNVDQWRPAEVKLPVKTDGLVIAGDRRPIPKVAMDRFLGHLKTQNKTWDDFLRWCKVNAPDALPLAWGVELDAIPAGVLPAMKAFLDDTAAPPLESAFGPAPTNTAPANEVVDRRTGEVQPRTTQRTTRPATSFTGQTQQGETVPDDDIPF